MLRSTSLLATILSLQKVHPEVIGCNTPQQVWTSLETSFLLHSHACILQLLMDLYNFKKKGFELVNKYFTHQLAFVNYTFFDESFFFIFIMVFLLKANHSKLQSQPRLKLASYQFASFLY